MTFLDKLMFWKKNDDFGADLGLGKDGGLGGNDFSQGMGNNFNDFGGNFGQNNADMGQGFGQSQNDLATGFPGDNFGMGSSPGSNPASSGFGAPRQGMPQAQQSYAPSVHPMYPSYGSQGAPIMPQQPSHQDMVGKDIEIVSSKIDALRATLESINQRLANIERIAYGEQEKRGRW